jgi:hypothetical protein
MFKQCICCNKHHEIETNNYFLSNISYINIPTKKQRKYLTYLVRCIKEEKNPEDIKYNCSLLIYYTIEFYFPNIKYYSGKITGIIVEYLKDNIKNEILNREKLINIITETLCFIKYNMCVCNNCHELMQYGVEFKNLLSNSENNISVKYLGKTFYEDNYIKISRLKKIYNSIIDFIY